MWSFISAGDAFVAGAPVTVDREKARQKIKEQLAKFVEDLHKKKFNHVTLDPNAVSIISVSEIGYKNELCFPISSIKSWQKFLEVMASDFYRYVLSIPIDGKKVSIGGGSYESLEIIKDSYETLGEIRKFRKSILARIDTKGIRAKADKMKADNLREEMVTFAKKYRTIHKIKSVREGYDAMVAEFTEIMLKDILEK